MNSSSSSPSSLAQDKAQGHLSMSSAAIKVNTVAINNNNSQIKVPKGFSTNGISMRWFIELIRSDEVVNNKWKEEDANSFQTIHFVERIKEITKEHGESIVEKLIREGEGKHIKWKADIFICHVWNSPFRDLVKVVEEIVETLPIEMDLYMWIDVLNVNQHKAGKLEFNLEFWTQTLHKVISSIGRMIVLLNLWNENNETLQRTWCLWEIYGASFYGSTKIEFCVVPSERNRFKDELFKNADRIMGRFLDFDIEKSKSSNYDDHEMIVNAAKRTPNGLVNIRNYLLEPLRTWMLNEALKRIEEIESSPTMMKMMTDEYDTGYIHLVHFAACILDGLGRWLEGSNLLQLSIKKLIDSDIKNNARISKHISCHLELCKTIGKYELGIFFCKNLIEAAELLYGTQSPEALESKSNLALLHQLDGNLDEAENIYRNILKSLSSPSISSSSSIASSTGLVDDVFNYYSSLNNLALLLESRGKFEESELYHRQALELLQKTHGKVHPDIAASMQNLGLVLASQNKLDEAERYFRKTLEMMSEIHGEYSKECSSLNYSLGKFLESRNKLDEADVYYQKAIEALKIVNVQKDPDLGDYLFDYGLFCQDGCRYEEAMKYLEESLSHSKSIYGNQHPKVMNITKAIGALLNAQGRYQEANMHLMSAMSLSNT